MSSYHSLSLFFSIAMSCQSTFAEPHGPSHADTDIPREATSIPGKKTRNFEKAISNGEHLIRCFSGVEERVNGSFKIISHKIMSLLSARERFDSFVFKLTKTLGAKHPTRNATEMPEVINDQTPEIKEASTIWPLFLAAQAIYSSSISDNTPLINFKSAASTYLKLATDYVDTLMRMASNHKLKKIQQEILAYAAMLNEINKEILPALEQLEDLYVRPHPEEECSYARRLAWATAPTGVESLSHSSGPSLERGASRSRSSLLVTERGEDAEEGEPTDDGGEAVLAD